MPNTERESMTIHCSHCGQLRLMATAAAYSHTVEHEIEDVGFYLERYVLRLAVCPSCQAVNLTAEDEDGRLRVWYVPLSAEPGQPRAALQPDEARSR